MIVIEVRMNLHEMVELCRLALSRILDDDERAILALRYVMTKDPPDGQPRTVSLEEIFMVTTDSEEIHPLSVEYIQIDPSEEEPSLISLDFHHNNE
ncbi:hypothetical protein ACFLY4_00790 [Chloroflexota bacterium]